MDQTKSINPRKLQIKGTDINQESCFGSTTAPKKVAAKILKLTMRKFQGGMQLVGGRRPINVQNVEVESSLKKYGNAT